MVDYRINLEAITDAQKKDVILCLKECKKLTSDKKNIVYLLDLMNQMYEREVYTVDNLHCNDCINNILNFWKIASSKWTV